MEQDAIAAAGFANPATVSITGLFVIARALRDHAGVDALIVASAIGRGVGFAVIPTVWD